MTGLDERAGAAIADSTGHSVAAHLAQQPSKPSLELQLAAGSVGGCGARAAGPMSQWAGAA